MKKLLAVLILWPLLAAGQIGNYPPLIGARGASNPAQCAIGQLFFNTGNASGAKIVGCESANTWVSQGGSGTVTSVSVTTANGVSGTVATATTTPAITLTLGAITPSSVTSAGAFAAGATGGTLTFSNTAGAGPTIAAGTATTDVAAFSITRTNNNAAVATGVLWTFTDTSSAGGFLPFQILGGVSGTTNLIKVNKSGDISSNGLLNIGGTSATPGAGKYLQFGAAALVYSPSDGILTIQNNAQTDFTRLQFGGTTSSFPSLKRSTTTLAVRLADDSADAPLSASALQATLGTSLTLTGGAIGMSKMTASASAPGATGAKLEVVCGTNAGTAKLTMSAGTSATVVTIIDNVGAAVTGC